MHSYRPRPYQTCRHFLEWQRQFFSYLGLVYSYGLYGHGLYSYGLYSRDFFSYLGLRLARFNKELIDSVDPLLTLVGGKVGYN